MQHTKILIIGSVLILAGGAYYFTSQNDTIAENRLLPNNQNVVLRGQSLYKEQCAACHGRNLEGQANWRSRQSNGKLPAPPHDETGHTWHHSDEVLINLTKKGPKSVAGPDYQTDMPAYENSMSHEDIIAVLSYIKSTWPKMTQDRQDRMNPAKN